MSTPNPKDPKRPGDGAKPKIPTAAGAKPPPKPADGAKPKVPTAAGAAPPLKYENAQLTVVMADPGNLQALDDLRNFLGIQQVEAVLALPRQIEEAIKTAYAGKQDNIADLIAELNADAALAGGRKETSIDL